MFKIDTVFYQSMEIMWKGMLSIFIVLIVIALVVLLLTKITAKQK